jgi:hypothetical protein
MDEMRRLLQELDAARDELWALIDPLDPDFEIYPGWTKREFYAHMGGWDGIVFDAFRSYRTGVPQRVFPYSDIDEANAYFVRVRKTLPLEDAKLESEINRFAIKIFLEAIPPERMGDLIAFPWGIESITRWTQGAINHELEHAQDIREMVKA